MATTQPSIAPLKIRTDSYSLEQLKDGLGNAAAGVAPAELQGVMADDDRRWDQLCDRAINTILPDVVSMLDAAIEAEWKRSPIEVEWRLMPKAQPA